MTPREFVRSFYSQAIAVERSTGIDSIAILAQAAIESGWARSIPGNMFFGIKDRDGINGNEQLLKTTEWSRSPNEKFPVILGIKKVIRNGEVWYVYRIRDYFRKYDSAEGSFRDHANFLMRNPRYGKALRHKNNTFKLLKGIADAGYATDPDYYKKVSNAAKIIIKELRAWLS